MVVVRESPHAKASPNKNDLQWPPKSPFEALLSSPSGRKKWEERRIVSRDGSVSPIPRKSIVGSRALQELATDSNGTGDTDEDEDEETLQLQLQALQAKLKLKKLQAKKKDEAHTGLLNSSMNARPMPSSKDAAESYQMMGRNDVQVPLSPVKERIVQPQEQFSPARRKLGLETVMKAENVSLKRARDGTHIKHTGSTISMQNREVETTRPKLSFSDRLHQSRLEAEGKRAKDYRIETIRSKGFGIINHVTAVPHTDQEQPRGTSPMRPSEKSTPFFSAPKHMQNGKSDSHNISDQSQKHHLEKQKSTLLPEANMRAKSTNTTQSRSVQNTSKRGSSQSSASSDTAGYDAFSQLHLSKRRIPHTEVARAVHDMEVYTLPRLLKEIKAPDYDPPDCENDFVLFALLASKSSPYNQNVSHHSTNGNRGPEDASAPRNKFMVLTLTDLNWEVDCFLFGTAFDQFWKLTPGTLLAVLNPAIMPPKVNVHSGRFSLKLGSSEDCVMEIGTARDLSWCTAVKKDGQKCGAWVNKSKTEVCDFHVNLAVERGRKGRMEVNSMWRGFDKGDEKLPGKMKSKTFDPENPRAKKDKTSKYHHEYGMLYGVPASANGIVKSAASILDAENTDTLSNLSAAELSRKRLAEKQRERDLVKALSKSGGGVGAEYIRAKHSIDTPDADNAGVSGQESHRFAKPTVLELGLMDRKAADIRLSPAKDRKRHFGMGALPPSSADHQAHRSSEALGWGGARKAGLLQPKDNLRPNSPERGQKRLGFGVAAIPMIEHRGTVRPRSQDSNATGSLSPSKKKARFMLDNKGIREPGRESGGSELLKLVPAATNHDDDDDDDDLDIV
ncbi:hypothetical protein K431DRAFT_281558 [Polychaeton citri CBS 116435]|uniref:Zinc finger Mcm10/DnaG-type domain-containing protein n=1 Tax=Polychaeton citri CBS 116435 TaxID=1314669 RepID=A0A9P4QHP6_9PEZI|nr:hypothetical protein K431DRAFT_281558 [Polychaeton citri CBS 116435]